MCGSVRPEPRWLVLRPHPPSMQPAAAAAAAGGGDDDDDDDDDEGDDVTVQRPLSFPVSPLKLNLVHFSFKI